MINQQFVEFNHPDLRTVMGVIHHPGDEGDLYAVLLGGGKLNRKYVLAVDLLFVLPEDYPLCSVRSKSIASNYLTADGLSPHLESELAAFTGMTPEAHAHITKQLLNCLPTE